MLREASQLLLALLVLLSPVSVLAQSDSIYLPDPYLEIPPPYLPDSRAGSSEELWKSAVMNISARLDTNPNQAALYFARGNAYAQIGQFPSAFDDYARALSLAPNLGYAYAARSWIETNKGQRAQGLMDAEKAITVAPGQYAGYVAKARWLELQPGGYEESQKSLREAVALLNKAIEVAPTVPDLYLQRARLLGRIGDQDGVISDMTDLLRMDPKRYVAYEMRAESWKFKGDIARQAQNLASAGLVAGGERGYYDYSRSADLEFGLGNFSRTVGTATNALAIKPDSVDMLILRGQAHDEMGNRAAASADFDKAFRIDPTAPSKILSKARSLKGSGQDKQSTSLAQKVIDFADKRLQKDPKDGGAYYVRYEANEVLGHRTAAAQGLMNAKRYYKPD